MNKDQRKYLTDWVSKGFSREQDQIKARRFPRPSLNNYLVADALQGKLRLKSAESITAYLQDRVIRSGEDKVLVTLKGSRRSWDDDGMATGKHYITLEAERVFEVPAEYSARLAEWEENERQVASDLERLEGTKETVLLKVNIGSDKALESVIAQADDLATLDLVNRQLTAGSPTKQLKD